jgi:hypothetical protein
MNETSVFFVKLTVSSEAAYEVDMQAGMMWHEEISALYMYLTRKA